MSTIGTYEMGIEHLTGKHQRSVSLFIYCGLWW